MTSTDALASPQQPADAAATMLPADLSACHAMIAQLLDLQHQKDRTIEQLEHQLQQLLRRLYGRSAEKLDANQLALFADLLKELKADQTVAPPPEPPPADPAPSNNGHGRRRLPADLPRERVIHDLSENEKPCPCCGKMRDKIGEEVSEKLDYVPAKIKVIQTVRYKYACKHCEAQANGPQIAIADPPLSPIDKGLAAPGLLSYVIVSKYSDHLPLHRLENILDRHGIDIARSTMCDWMAQSAATLLPLYHLMVQQVLASKVIHTDDTPVDVLDKKLPQARIGRFWVYLGDGDHPCTVFDYTPSRSRDGPMRFLADWGKNQVRYLQADAFGGYDGIYRGEAGGKVIEVACWSHTRRKFFDARATDVARGTAALAHIRLLYDVEDQANKQFRAQKEGGEARSLSSIRLELRQKLALPRLAQFKAWLEAQQAVHGGPVLPKSAMGQGIQYALNQWDALCVYATDGDLSIDNNASENALRRIAVGRGNWLFCGSDNGGTTAAVLFSFIATCQRHHVNPFDYLRDVLTRIAATPISKLAELLPGRWKSQPEG
jgi:transposase